MEYFKQFDTARLKKNFLTFWKLLSKSATTIISLSTQTATATVEILVPLLQDTQRKVTPHLHGASLWIWNYLCYLGICLKDHIELTIQSFTIEYFSMEIESLHPTETFLEDNYPVFETFYYIKDDNTILKSPIEGTVKELKVVTRSQTIRRVNVVERNLH